MSEERILGSLSETLGLPKRSGGNHTFNCPYCEHEGLSPDSGRNLWVHLGKRCFQCWRCQRTGTLAKLLKFLDLPEEGVQEHVDDLNAHVSQTLFTWVDGGACSAHRPLSFATGLLADTFLVDPSKPSSSAPMAYLTGRGFDWKMLAPYSLRYALRGKYEFRIINPCFENGECVYFTARTIMPGEEWKYLNPPKEIVPIGRENVVYGIDNIRPGHPCIIVEGQLNAMMLGLNAVACLGKAVTDVQVDKLLSKGCSEYICALDDDAWAQNVGLAKRLADRTIAKVSLVTWPKGKDAVDLGAQEAFMRVLNRTEYSLSSHLLGPVINLFPRRTR